MRSRTLRSPTMSPAIGNEMICRPPSGSSLIAAGPARLENEGLVAGLPFLGELLAPLHSEGIRLQVRKARQLVGATRPRTCSASWPGRYRTACWA